MMKVAADIFFCNVYNNNKISYLGKMPTFEILTLIGKKGGGMSFARTHLFSAITVQHLHGTANGKQTLLF